MHRNSILIKIQPDATVCRYLFTTKSLYMFRVSKHPSSGVLTVTEACGTSHNIGTATSLQRGPRWREVAVPILWPVPEAAVTVFCIPGDECSDTRNMFSDFAVNKYLHTVASSWIFINIPICLHSNKNCGMCSSNSRTCTANLLQIEETKNLPEEYNGRGAPQWACTNERS